ncbi:MAG: hypothetical protein IJ583_10690, partial [Firmicutes bacterium]|nr:hypothetical protein [Bacillota bacterium]
RIGDSDVPYDDVVEVYSTSASVKDENTSNISKNMVVDQALGLIGKCVQAFTLDEEGNVTGFTEGKVGYVKFDGETPVLNINGTDVNTYEVISVSDDMMLKGKTIGYDNGEETLYGEVKDVEISGDNVYLNIDGESVQIVDISSMMNALSLIGEDVSYGGISGTVESIVIRNALPYLMTANGEINYKDVNK